MKPHWETVERPDGTSYDIRSAEVENGTVPAVLGHAHFTLQGWVAEAEDGRSYGPFTSLSEAAYPLAMGDDDPDARLLLGPPIPPGGLKPPPPLSPPRLPPPRNHDRLLSVALFAVGVLAIVAGRRSRAGERRP